MQLTAMEREGTPRVTDARKLSKVGQRIFDSATKAVSEDERHLLLDCPVLFCGPGAMERLKQWHKENCETCKDS
jgi:hypothetical protein